MSAISLTKSNLDFKENLEVLEESDNIEINSPSAKGQFSQDEEISFPESLISEISESSSQNNDVTENSEILNGESGFKLVNFYDLKPAKYFFIVWSFIINFISIIINMVNSDINTLIDVTLNLLGVPQERINRKFIKKAFILLLMVVSFARSSRKDGVHQNFETHQLFSRHSLVTDFFHGELSHLNVEIFYWDMTLVMYYAPWDRQSQNFVPHFLKVAQYHHEQVFFAAINCWLPGSECRQHLKFQYFPAVVLHVKISSLDEVLTVPYNGPLSAHHLIRFINKALNPYTYISNQTELLEAQLGSQVIVLGYYDIGNYKKDFLCFYLAAVSRLQFEHMADVKYALITNPELAKIATFSHKPSIHLITWNTTLGFPSNIEKNFRNITKFVDFHMNQVIRWLPINGRKSLALNNVFQRGPFLIVFSPDNPYHTSNDPFQLTRSVALEYFNCNFLPFQLWIGENLGLKTRSELRESDKICRAFLKDHLNDTPHVLNSIHVRERNNCGMDQLSGPCKWEEVSSFSHFTWNRVWGSFIEKDTSLVSFPGACLKTDISSNCVRTKNESVGGKFSYRHPSSEEAEQHVLKGPIEDDHIAKLKASLSEEHCKRLVLGSLLAPAPLVIEFGKRQRINGLSCQVNKTLKFVAVDSLLHKDFAQQLGVNLSDTVPKHSGIIIVDPESEERYILNQPLSRNSIASFVYNFTHNLLDRGKLSGDFNKGREECSPGEVCLMELNGKNYLKLVNTPKQAFIVMHYSHHCGACSSIANTFLNCMHLSSGVSNLTFARIDVSKNTLPWHLTFDAVPTFVFFPHDKESRSRVFDPHLPVTVKNIMRFILSGLRQPERNAFALKLCNSECRKATTSQSLLMKIKLHHSISIHISKLKRYISFLVQLKSQMLEEPNNFILQAKYDLIFNIKSTVNRKIGHMKSKLSHLNQLKNYIPFVPLKFPNQLSHETKLMEDKRKIEL